MGRQHPYRPRGRRGPANRRAHRRRARVLGDPLADFVSLALLGDIRQDEAFLAGYRNAGGPARLDASSQVRLALYRSYLYLIMLVEAGPREYSLPQREWLERRVAPALATELDLLRR